MERKTKILLIDPTDQWITNNRVLKHHDQVMLPIGLMYLSAYLKQQLADKVDIKIVSTIVDLTGPESLRQLLVDFAPDIVAVRCVIFYAEQISQILETARQLLPDSLLIAGGPNVTFDNENLQANPDIDVLIEGEGEETLFEVVDRFIRCGKQGLLEQLPQIESVIFRSNGEVVKN